jgi:hypothetical protein
MPSHKARAPAGDISRVEPTQPASNSPLGDSLNEGPRRSISDQPTEKDTMGFRPYVRALAEFLINPDTEPPLTVSIEGEWGSGKSSFMKQLANEVERITQSEDIFAKLQALLFGRPTRVIWINAWRHDKLNSLFAGFAIKFLEDLRKGTPILKRSLGSLLLWFRRFDWSDGGIFAFARLVVLWVFFASAACFVATKGVPSLFELWDRIERKGSVEMLDGQAGKAGAKHTHDLGASKNANQFIAFGESGLNYLRKRSGSQYVASWTGYLLILLLLFEKIAKLSDPIRLDARKRILAPEYEKSLGLLEHFHKDFDRIITAYLGESKRSRRRVFVFVDDLDRCEVPKAADLMQGLNLLISDSPQLVFILGIDRQKIAAAIAVKYKDYLPYFPVPKRLTHAADEVSNLDSAAASPDRNEKPSRELETAFDPMPGLEFGYSFMEKFIQIVFQVPRMTTGQLDEFLMGFDSAQFSNLQKQTIPDDGSVTVGEDNEEILEIAKVVSKSLGFNPRRLKQFLNVFRLQRFIAVHTKRLKSSVDDSVEGATVQQLGKFVALVLKWPGLLMDLKVYPDLLELLTKEATTGSPSADISPDQELMGRLFSWSARSGLRDLLLASPLGAADGPTAVPLVDEQPPFKEDPTQRYLPPEWDLSFFDVESFLNVATAFIPIAPRSKQGASKLSYFGNASASSGVRGTVSTETTPTGGSPTEADPNGGTSTDTTPTSSTSTVADSTSTTPARTGKTSTDKTPKRRRVPQTSVKK